MANPFDQFEPPAQKADSATANPFDQFEPPAPVNPVQPKPVASDEPGDFMRGLKRTVPELKQLGGGTLAAIGDVTGIDAIRDKGLEIYRAGNEVVSGLTKPTDSATEAWQRVRQGNLGAGIDFLQNAAGYTTGQAIESIIAAGAGAAIGAAAGSGAAPGPGTAVGGAAGAIGGFVGKQAVKRAVKDQAEKIVAEQVARGVAKHEAKQAGRDYVAQNTTKEALAKGVGERFTEKELRRLGGAAAGTVAGQQALNTTMELGSVYPEAMAKAQEEGREMTRGDKARAVVASLGAAGLESVADMVNLGILFRGTKGAVGDAAKEGVGAAVRRYAGRAARAGAEGSLREAGTEAAQTVLERIGAGHELNDADAWRDYIDSAAVGAVGGALFGGVAAFHPRNAQGQPVDQSAREVPEFGADPADALRADVLQARSPKARAEAAQALFEHLQIEGRLLPPPEPVMVDPAGVATTPAQRDQLEQQRMELGLTPDVDAARAAHPAAAPNVPFPEAQPGSLASAANTLAAGVAGEALAAAPPPAGVDPETGEVLAEQPAREPWSRDQVKSYLAAQLERGHPGALPKASLIATTWGMKPQEASALRKEVIEESKRAVAGAVAPASVEVSPAEEAVQEGSPEAEAGAPAVQSGVPEPTPASQIATSAPPRSSLPVEAQGERPGSGPRETGEPQATPSTQATPAASPVQGTDVPVDPDAIIEVKDRYGVTHRVRQGDLDGTREQLRRYNRNGTPKTGSAATIHRENVDLTGELRAEQLAQTANNPLMDVVTNRRGGAFKTVAAAKAMATREGYADTHEVAPVNGGFVLRRRAPADALAASANAAATSPENTLQEPSEAQKDAGNYKKGHTKIAGLDISIENPAGSRRRPEWPPLANHYGYIRGSVGKDKDHVDVFMTDDAADTSRPVFIVDQRNSDGTFDEHKVILGAKTKAEARRTYLANYSKGWKGAGAVTQMTHDEFEAWVRDPAKTRRPASAPAGKSAETSEQRRAKIDASFAANRQAIKDKGLEKGDRVTWTENGKVVSGTILNLGDKEQAVVAVGRPGRDGGVRDSHVPASQLNKVEESGAGQEAESALRAAWERYDDSGEDTINDLADAVEAAIDNGVVAPELARAVSAFRQEQEDDRDLSGRNDMDAAEEALSDAVAEWVNGETPPATPAPKSSKARLIPTRGADGGVEIRVEPVVEEEGAAGATDLNAALVLVAEDVAALLRDGKAISPKALFDLANAKVGGTQAQGAYTPRDAYDALELGVNMALKQGLVGSLNPASAAEAAQLAVALRKLLAKLPTQSKRTKEQDEFQQFSTPPTLAFLAARAANLTAADTVLEPSAGTGDLVIMAQAAGATVVANELAPRRAALLRALGVEQVFTENAEQLDNILPDSVQPSVILMNPPFSATAGRMGQGFRKTAVGAQHVEQALQRLAPGGRLVAIVGEGMAADRPAFRKWWGKIQKEYAVRANIGLSGKAYAKYGTTFDNQLLVIDKTGPTTGEILTQKFDSAEAALPTIEALRNDAPDREVPGNGEVAQREAAEPARAEAPAEGRGDSGRQQPVPAATGRARPAERAGREPSGSETDGGRAAPAGGEGSGAGVSPADEQRGGGQPDAAVRGAEDAGAGAAVPAGDAGGVAIEAAEEPSRATGKITNSIFEQYQPQRLRVPGAKPHPGALVQSAAMAAVEPPAPSYTPNLPKAVVAEGKLSLAQLEAVVYAGQAHEQILPNGERRGFFIGDGTGVGKGREISGIILDNLRQGRGRAVWVSEKPGLLTDAKRDFAGVGGDVKLLSAQSKVKKDAAIDIDSGVLFTTYATLRQGSSVDGKAVKKAGKSRVDQIAEWLGADFDGVVVFDEAHNAGNAVTMKGKRGKTKPSAQALAVVDLQKKLPNARVVYVSATGATEVSNLSYATRLGLWGEGTAFPSVESFINAIHQGGLAAMELVSRDMKALGVYTARSLSFDGVTYARLEHPLTDFQREVYDELAKAWQGVLRNIDDALQITSADANTNAKAAALAQFWGAQQRFFNQVLTAMQTPSVLTQIEADLAAGDAVVLQIVNTYEAAQTRALAEIQNEEDLEALDITPRDGLIQYVRNSFPVAEYEEYLDEQGNKRSRPVQDSAGNPVLNKQAVRMRDELVQTLEQIRVPESPLDIIINHFGPNRVAEVTGRKRRVVRRPDPKTGVEKTVVQNRGSTAPAAEASEFQAGKRDILIFSDAGGTGFSFHADRTAKNQKRRQHYLLQAGWRADKAVQGFGRTHRTNEASQPNYRLVTTDLPAQKRFLSSIARRLDQLGALTKGQRDTANQGLFSAKDNLESQYAQDAVTDFLQSLYRGRIDGMDFNEISRELGFDNLIDERGGGLNVSKLPNVPQFLNRMLSLTVDRQGEVFDQFVQRLEARVDAAIANGTLDTGMQTIEAEKVTKVDEHVLHTDTRTGSQTKAVTLELQHKVRLQRFPEAVERYVRNVNSQKVWAVRNLPDRTNRDGTIERVVELAGTGSRRIEKAEILQGDKFEEIGKDDARAAWEAENEKRPKFETERRMVLTGSLLPIWDRIKGDVKVVRAQTEDGERLIGRLVDRSAEADTLEAFGVGVETMSADEVMAAVMEKGETAQLANGWRLKRVRVSNEQRLEVVTAQSYLPNVQSEITRLGGFVERIQWQQRLFLPVGDTDALARLLEARPFKSLVGNEDEGNAIRLSRPDRRAGRGIDLQDLGRNVARWTRMWDGAAPMVVPVPTAENLPERARAGDGWQDAEGFYDEQTGTVYLVAANLRDTRRAQQVLAHEAFGHYGIEAITGPALWAELSATIRRMRENGRHADLFAEIGRRYRGANSEIFTREAIAVMAEKGIRNSVIDRVIAAVRRFLREVLHIDLRFSEAELRQHLVAAARYVRGDSRPRVASQPATAGAFSRPGLDLSKEIPVIALRGGRFGSTGTDAARRMARERAFAWLERMRAKGQRFHNEDGDMEIGLSRDGNKELRAWTAKPERIALLAALPEVTRRAVLARVDVQREPAGAVRRWATFYAPVMLDNQLRIARLVARDAGNGAFAYDLQASDVMETTNPALAGSDGGGLSGTEPGAPTALTVAQIRDLVNGVDRPGWAMSRRPGTFFSALVEAIESGRGAPKKGDAAAWRGWLDGAQRRGEIRQAERDWLGLDVFLERNGVTTREDLAEFVRANEVQVQDVVLGEQGGLGEIQEAFAREGYGINDEGMDVEEMGVTYTDPDGNEVEFDDLPESLQAVVNANSENGGRVAGETKFGKYTLPGGKNYRELLLTLPPKADAPKFDPAKVEIRRNRSSVTQGTVTLFYDGQEFGGPFEDRGTPANNYRTPDSEWMQTAERIFNDGIRDPMGRTVAESVANRDAFRSSHFDQPNILAHVRFNERTDADGQRVLFLEEIQSDWAQEGRKRGFGTQARPDPVAREMYGRSFSELEDFEKFTVEAEVEARNNGILGGAPGVEGPTAGVPDMPFKNTDEWAMLAFKRMVRWAVDNGFDRIAWTTGQQQADRYDLAKTVSQVSYSDGNRLIVRDKGGSVIFNETTPENRIADVIGKEAAERLLAAPPRDWSSQAGSIGARARVISGDGLKMGGDGMRAFYDKILPSAVNKWGKRFGAKVGQTRIPGRVSNPLSIEDAGEAPNFTGTEDVHALDITPAMRDAASAGLPLFSRPDPASTIAAVDVAAAGIPGKLAEKAMETFRALDPKNLRENMRPAWLGALPLRQLAELANDIKLKHIGRYADRVQRMQTDRNIMQEEATEVSDVWERFQRKDRAGADATANLMHDSTIAGVDPSKDYRPLFTGTTKRGGNEPVTAEAINRRLELVAQDLSEAKGKTAKARLEAEAAELRDLLARERARAAAYPELVRRWLTLPEEGRKVYIAARDAYAKQSDRLEEAIIDRINATAADDRTRQSFIAQIRLQFESARLEGPYFPLARFGDFWISAEDQNGAPRFFMYERVQDWRAAQRDLLAQGFVVKAAGRKIGEARGVAGASTGFMADLEKMLANAGIDDQTRDEVWQLYLRTLPELSMRKHYIHRKKTAGYSDDALRAFAGNMFHGSFQIARVRHTHALEAELLAMKEATAELAKDDPERAVKAAALTSEVNLRHEWVMNPKDSKAVSGLTSLGFAWYLGVTPAAAVVNLTQTAIVAFPVLASRFGAGKAANALSSAMGRAMRNVDGNLTRGLSDEERRAFQIWRESGAIDRTLAHNLAGLSETDTRAFSPVTRRAMNLVSFLFHRAEVVNREATALAAFRLARKDGQSFSEAVEYAEAITLESHFDYSNANRARYMQSNAAKVLLLFRQYSLNMTWLLWRNAYLGWKGETKEVQVEARKKLAGVLGMTGVFAGTLGMPLTSIIFGVANAAAAAFGDDDDPFDAEVEFRNFLADMLGPGLARIITNGPVEALTGAEIGNRVSLNDLWFREPNRELEGQAKADYLLEQAAGPVFGGMLVNSLRGWQLVEEGHTWRGVETMMPKIVKDGLKSTRYATQGVNTLRGDPIIEDLNVGQALLQLAGFSPASLNERYDGINASKRYEQRILDARSNLLNAYAMAWRADDRGAMDRVTEKIQAWNTAHPEIPITTKTIRQSLSARMRYSSRAESGVVLDRRVAEQAREQARFAR